MHFLIDASLPRSAGTVLRQLGHEATDVRDVGMRDAPGLQGNRAVEMSHQIVDVAVL